MAQLTFEVASILFSKDGFAAVRTTNGASVSGKFRPVEGLVYKADGQWESHPTYGPQFKVASALAQKLTTPEALGRFLSRKLKGKGIGEAVIGHLVTACSESNLDLEAMLDNNERELLIDCVGKRNESKVDILLKHWADVKPQADLVSPLLGLGLSDAAADSCVHMWGKEAYEQVTKYPYQLMLKVSGVSFLTADKIARGMGQIGLQDTVRLEAALATGLRDATSLGDLGVLRRTLITKTLPLVNESVLENGRRKLAPGVELVVPSSLLESTLDDMIKSTKHAGTEFGFARTLIEYPDSKGNSVVWYKPLVDAEDAIAKRIVSFDAKPRHDLIANLGKFCARHAAVLAPEQEAAVKMALTHPVSVITGGPGCGKSFLLKVLLTALDSADIKGHLCAPTGKAAKRITESTGRPASTIHSLLGAKPTGGWNFDQHNPLTAGYLVIDEASMVDTELMDGALAAAESNCRIILVGDVDQLASVGPGQVLRDLINSEVLPVTRLTRGFRFSGGIASAARKINAGVYPESSEDGQFVLVETEEPAKAILEAAKELKKSGVDEDDIQILAPTHKGTAGCVELNAVMQGLFNPITAKSAPSLKRESGTIYPGDRVIQLKNEKELRIVNGDIGLVESISASKGDVVLNLPDRDKSIHMTSEKAQNLGLAYAITVHKSQGAEAPYVLMALDPASVFMLRRNLVYTGITRGSKQVMLFTSPSTLASAVRRGEPIEGSRRTSLVEKLKAAYALKVSSVTASAAPSSATMSDYEDLPF